MCESYNRQCGTDFLSVMPCNLYGPGDNYHPQNSHVILALIRRIHEAKSVGAESVTIWGTGTPTREFLHVDDLASACVELIKADKEEVDAHVEPMRSHINIGTAEEVSISQLAQFVCQCVGIGGTLKFDPSFPDDTPRKTLDTSRLKTFGFKWTPISLQAGLALAYKDFLVAERARSNPASEVSPQLRRHEK